MVAIDLSPKLVDLARDRLPATLGQGSIAFLAGDMLDPALGRFDHVVAMDSLIHYSAGDMAAAVAGLAARTAGSIVFTFAPRTPALALMHAAGKLFPRGDKSPAIEPVPPAAIRRRLAASGLTLGASERVASGFYISQMQEVLPR